MQVVKGKYQDGKVQLLEPAPQISGDVLVIFSDEKTEPLPNQMIQFGMFAGSHQSTEADFQLAEFSGDKGDLVDW